MGEQPNPWQPTRSSYITCINNNIMLTVCTCHGTSCSPVEWGSEHHALLDVLFISTVGPELHSAYIMHTVLFLHWPCIIIPQDTFQLFACGLWYGQYCNHSNFVCSAAATATDSFSVL